MSVKKTKKRGLKIFFIILGTFILLVSISVYLFFIPWIKEKAIRYVENNSEYKLKINSIVFTGFHSLEITGMELRPKLDVKQFYLVDHIERDWIKIKAHISVEGINWKMLLWHKKMYADKICLKDAKLFVYRDKRMPDAPYKYKPLHSYILRHASVSITFPLVQIEKARIEYEENPESGPPTKIVFSKLYGTLHHLSTDSDYILHEPLVILDGKGMVLDSIEATMQYKFSTLKDRFTFEGHTGSFSTTLFNEYITPITGAKIKSGHVERVNLFFHADDSIATGTLDMDFNDLKVDIMSKHGKKSPIKTFLSHIFLNKDDIKRNGEEEDAGIIHSLRKKDRSVFSYWWTAIKSGLVSSVVKKSILKKKKTNHTEKKVNHKEHKHHHLL
jgi:hypothetical protein